MAKPKLVEIAPGMFSFDHLEPPTENFSSLLRFELGQSRLHREGKIDQLTEVKRVSVRRAREKLSEVLNNFSSGKRMIQVLQREDGEPVAVLVRPSDAVRLLELNRQEALETKLRHDKEFSESFNRETKTERREFWFDKSRGTLGIGDTHGEQSFNGKPIRNGIREFMSNLIRFPSPKKT